MHASMTLTPSKIEVKVRGHMSLATLQMSLTIHLLRYVATVLMSVSKVPELFLFLSLT